MPDSLLMVPTRHGVVLTSISLGFVQPGSPCPKSSTSASSTAAWSIFSRRLKLPASYSQLPGSGSGSVESFMGVKLVINVRRDTFVDQAFDTLE